MMLAYGLPGLLALVGVVGMWLLASWAIAVAVCHWIFRDDDGPHRPFQVNVHVREIML